MSHGPEYYAYYQGRNSVWNEEEKLKKTAFQTDAEYTSYLRGRKHAASEEKLNIDTSWDD